MPRMLLSLAAAAVASFTPVVKNMREAPASLGATTRTSEPPPPRAGRTCQSRTAIYDRFQINNLASCRLVVPSIRPPPSPLRAPRAEKEDIARLALQASQLAALEELLGKVVSVWEVTEYPLALHGSQHILGGLDDIIDQLDDSRMTIGTILGSRFVGPIKNVRLSSFFCFLPAG